ncbi:MAG: hypothetical protein EXR01_06820 [Acetobacteraceae bacterium]|nr:hypothetical protein [Acetobacteraceae bacterium]
MDIAAFRASLSAGAPPPGLSHALAALWWDARHDWGKAHEAAQKDDGPQGCAVHAYLHRVEGDLSNARYWYNRASRAPAADALKDEWERLAVELTT